MKKKFFLSLLVMVLSSLTQAGFFTCPPSFFEPREPRNEDSTSQTSQCVITEQPSTERQNNVDNDSDFEITKQNRHLIYASSCLSSITGVACAILLPASRPMLTATAVGLSQGLNAQSIWGCLTLDKFQKKRKRKATRKEVLNLILSGSVPCLASSVILPPALTALSCKPILIEVIPVASSYAGTLGGECLWYHCGYCRDESLDDS